MAEQEVIRLRGVRQHNLKNLDLDIPLYRLLAISGVSGSGKSSLALHTLYAEGQRRYVETFSPYARQFLERMDPPEADLIDGIPPSIAIESGTAVRSSRSTVGTITEINDYLKLLYARLAVPYCPRCGQPISQDNPESVYQKLQEPPPRQSSPGRLSLPSVSRLKHRPPGRCNRPRRNICRAPSWNPWQMEPAPDFPWISSRLQRRQDLRSGKPQHGRSGKYLGKRNPGGCRSPLLGQSPAARVKDSLATAFKMGNNRLAVVILPGPRSANIADEPRRSELEATLQLTTQHPAPSTEH